MGHAVEHGNSTGWYGVCLACQGLVGGGVAVGCARDGVLLVGVGLRIGLGWFLSGLGFWVGLRWV